MAKKQPKLTLKQRNLVNEYIKVGEYRQAAINAGYAPKSAKSTAAITLKLPHVKAYWDKRMKELDDASIADMKEVRQRLTQHARGEIYDENVVTVKVPEVQDVPDKYGGTRKQVVYVEHAKLVKTKIKPSDQIKALELLGKTGALFTDKTDITASIEPVKIIDDIPNEQVEEVKDDG